MKTLCLSIALALQFPCLLLAQDTAVITGRVLDEGGEPQSNMEVLAVSCCMWTYGNKHDFLETEARSVTDDRGEYRLLGVKPGAYYVVAKGDPDRSLQQTFYPGVTETRLAQQVAARSGTEVRADFSLVRRQHFQIDLRVALPQGWSPQLAPPDRVHILPRQLDIPFEWSGPSFRATQDRPGVYTSDLLPPGVYDIASWISNESSADKVWVYGQLSVEVRDGDVDAGTLTLQRGITLRGRVIDRDKVLSKTKGRGPYMHLRAMNVVAFPESHGASVQEDGTFVFPSVPKGRYHVELDESDFVLEAELYGGRDTRDTGFRLEGESTSSLELVLSGSSATVEGVVRNAQGEPVPRAHVALIPPPARRENWMFYYDAQTDDVGVFRLEHVRPGDYTALAQTKDDPDRIYAYYLFMRDYLRPNFPAVVAVNGVPVSLEKGVAKTITLRVVPNPRP